MDTESGAVSERRRAERRATTPPLLARLTARGNTLRRHRPFLEALQQARDDWNRDYPEFPIDTADPLSDPTPEGWVYPPALAVAQSENRRRMEEDGTTGDDQIETAVGEWRRLAAKLSRTWWPVEDFPDLPDHWYYHPAQPFVAVCLLRGLDNADPGEWIRAKPRDASVVCYDPTDVGGHPGEVQQRAAYDRLSLLLDNAARAGEPITLERLREMHADAEATGKAALWGAASLIRPYWSLRLDPNLSTTDWQGLQARVKEVLDAQGHPVYDRAHELAQQGEGESEIGRRLGIDRATARRWIRDGKEGNP